MTVDGACNASTVVGVPPCAAASLFSDVMFMKEFGAKGLITCCLQENMCKPTDVGAVRRITLNIPSYVDNILREKLIEVRDGPHHMVSRMEYMPCTCDDRRRSPFGFEGSRVLKRAVTTFTVTRVTTNPNKCFVDISTEFTVDVALSPEGTIRTRDEILFNDIKHFWQQYVDRTIVAASEYLLSISLPRVKRDADNAYDSTYRDLEEAVCNWSVSKGPTLDRLSTLRIVEKALDAWSHARRELKHQEMLNSRLEDDFQGARIVAAAAAASAAASLAANIAGSQPSAPMNTSRAASLKSAVPRRTHSSAAPEDGYSIDVGSSVGGGNNGDEGRTAADSADKIEHNPFFSPSGGRVLSVPESECHERTSAKQAADQAARDASLQDLRTLIAGFVTNKGLVNEPTAQALFSKLDYKRRGYVTEQEVTKLLRQIDPLGLYEDRDGTMKMLAAYRDALCVGVYNKEVSERVEPSCREEMSSGESTDYASVAVQASPPGFPAVRGETVVSGEKQESATGEDRLSFAAVLQRYCSLKGAMQEDAVNARAKDMLRKYAFKARGKLHYDEFCIMMLHVLREY